jgi:hypothetical protein
MTTILRALTVLLLLGACWAKVWSGYDPRFSVPPQLYWAAALTECVLAALLVGCRWRFGAYATIIFSAAGVVHGFMVPLAQPCGCFGTVLALDGRGRILLAAGLGFLASLSLRGRANPRSSTPLARDAAA